MKTISAAKSSKKGHRLAAAFSGTLNLSKKNKKKEVADDKGRGGGEGGERGGHGTLDSQMMKEIARLAKEQARQQGKGFLGQWGAMIGSGGGDHYLNMQPQAILNEHPNNFFLMNNQIQSVRIRRDHDQQTGQTRHRIEFKAASGKTRLVYQNLDEGRAKQLLQQVLGKAVR